MFFLPSPTCPPYLSSWSPPDFYSLNRIKTKPSPLVSSLQSLILIWTSLADLKKSWKKCQSWFFVYILISLPNQYLHVFEVFRRWNEASLWVMIDVLQDFNLFLSFKHQHLSKTLLSFHLQKCLPVMQGKKRRKTLTLRIQLYDSS